MLNKKALTRRVNKAVRIPLYDASMCVDVVIESIAESIAKGERIELRGLGSFSSQTVKARMYFSTYVPEHRRITFRPSETLRKAVRKLGN